MTGRQFAAWVQPLAQTLDADRLAVIEFARGLSGRAWDEPSAVEGWSRKHILAHLAGGNDQLVQLVLRSVVSRQAPDPALLNPDTDAENARRVTERRSWTVEALIAELERDGEELQALLSQLGPEDESLRFPGFALSLGQFLGIVKHERHDAEHLAHMQAN